MFGLEKIKMLENDLISLNKELIEEKKKRLDQARELDKLHRILKHHGNGPSYELERFSWICCNGSNTKLYMYIDDEEYIIELPELNYVDIDRDTIKFGFDLCDKKFVCFEIQNGDHLRVYKFTIDYEKGNYICRTETLEKESEESNA